MALTIFKRLTIGYLAIMFVVIFLGVYVTLELNQLNRITQDVIAVDSSGIRLTENLLSALLTQRSFEKKYLVSKDQDFYEQFWKVRQAVTRDLVHLRELMGTGEKKPIFEEVNDQYERYVAIVTEEFEATARRGKYDFLDARDRKEHMVGVIDEKLHQIIDMARAERDEKLVVYRQISIQVSRTTGITAAVVIVMGILISFFNTRSINNPIHLLQEKTKEISKGRFEEVPCITSPPEMKELVDGFNMMCERLRELDEMKADFISHVSHELRTPLTAIKEASSMLLEGGFAGAPKKQEALLRIMNEECERLIRSVNRILDLSSMEARMTEYFFEECDLRHLLQNTVSKFAAVGLRNNIALDVNLPADLPLVRIDENRIEQVIENLLGNAFKHTKEGGRIGVAALSCDNGKKYVEVSVSDTGCGIPERDLEKIFEKFKRIETRRGSTGGTGLGLSIAKHIVTAHGGRIWVESKPGQGSVFRFSVPGV